MGKIVLFLGMGIFSDLTMAADAIEVNHINDVTHIEISGLGASDYTINRKDKTVELKVNHLGDDKVQVLKNYKDRHVIGVDVQKSPALDQDIITLKLASSEIEMFDYLTDSPSSLSIDLYYDDEKEKAKTVSASTTLKSSSDADADEDEMPDTESGSSRKKKKKNKVLGHIHIEEKDYKKMPIERQLASDEFAKIIPNTSLLNDLDKETLKKVEALKKEEEKERAREKAKDDKTDKKLRQYFEAKNPLDIDIEVVNFPIDILIEARDKVYLRFPVLLNESAYLNSIIARPVSYEIAEANDPETKDFGKALKMFEKKDFKSFFKTKKIFNKKYPKSKYTEMISFMAADAMLLIWKQEKKPELLEESLRLYDALVSKYPASSITERTHLLLAYIRMKEKKYLDATRSLKTYVELYKASPLRENIKLILAQSLMRNKQYRDAGTIYEELARSQANDVREAANFEKGDVFLEKKDYENAIKYYQVAIAQTPAAAPKFPNIFFNLAEAQFMNEEYRNSLKSYRKFIEQHPQHPYAAYAWTRIGEILEIANKDESVWRGFYNESIFRFNQEEGARIARIHLIRQDAPRAPAHKLDLYIDELKTLAKEIKLDYIEDYIVFQISDIYYDRKRFKESVDYLLTFFKEQQIPLESQKFHKRIGRAIAGLLQHEIENGTADSGVQTLKEYDELWLKKSKLLSFNYYKGRIYGKAGMNKMAEDYYKKYLASIEKLDFSQTTEKLPNASLANMHLTRSQLNAKKIPEALATLEKIKGQELSEKDNGDYIRLKRDIAIARQDWNGAEGHAKTLNPATKDDYLVLASIYDQMKNADKAVETIDSYVNTFKPSNEEKFEVLKTKIDYLSRSSNADKYKTFLKRFYSEFKNSKSNFDKEKYDLGKIYIQEGNLKDANDVIGRITKNSIWDKLALEYKEQQDWDQKYKKYIDRVPAMNKKEEGK